MVARRSGVWSRAQVVPNGYIRKVSASVSENRRCCRKNRAGMFSRRTNQTQFARVYSHGGPIRRNTRGYILRARSSGFSYCRSASPSGNTGLLGWWAGTNLFAPAKRFVTIRNNTSALTLRRAGAVQRAAVRRDARGSHPRRHERHRPQPPGVTGLLSGVITVL